MTPLVPILVPLIVTAIVLSVIFARYLPAPPPPAAVPAPRFTDVTPESGITFRHAHGPSTSPTTLSGAVAVLDFDRDGYPDLFFVNGGPWPWEEAASEEPLLRPTAALFRNDGTGHFTDVTRAAGLELALQGVSVAVGDFDRDGWPDLYLTAVGGNRLLRNDGQGRFIDVTSRAGVGGDEQTWSSGALWLDTDNDGWLDLIVCRYARWPQEIELELAFKIAGVGRSYGAPAGFVSASPLLYRNRGDGTFEEIGAAAGLRNLDPATGLPRPLPLLAAALDANQDGRLDVVLTHHTVEPVLFINQGDGSFREWVPSSERRREGAAAGLAASGGFPFPASRGAGDPWSSLRAVISALTPPAPAPGRLATRGAFVWLHEALHGRSSVLAAGSSLEADLNRFDDSRALAGPLLVLRETEDGWQPVSWPDTEAAWARPLVARGLATADLDGDGDLDVVVVEHQGWARILRNDQRSTTPWLRVALTATRSAPGGPGARVEVHTPRRVQVQTMAPAMSLLSQSEAPLTFSLGEDTRVRKIVVRWPSGLRQEVRPPGLNRTLEIVEP